MVRYMKDLVLKSRRELAKQIKGEDKEKKIIQS